jgi:hypothetical protein
MQRVFAGRDRHRRHSRRRAHRRKRHGRRVTGTFGDPAEEAEGEPRPLALGAPPCVGIGDYRRLTSPKDAFLAI